MSSPVSRRVPFQWSGGEIWPRLNYHALFETFTISDSLGNTHEILAPLTDTIAFSDSAGVAFEIAAISDSMAFSDSAGAILSLHAAASDSMAFSDSVGSMQLADASDSIAFSDVLGPTFYYPITLADSMAFADSAQSILFVAASDSMVFSDLAGAILSLHAAAEDTFVFSDSVSDSATNLQRIVVMNLDTGAVSEYVLPVVVTGIAQHNGVLYLTTSNGLFALDATTDDNDDITWHWRTGLTHLGSDQVKRPIDLNILGRIEGTATAEVVTIQEGTKRIDYYPIPNMTRSAHRDAIVKPGKGLNSVYWSFGEQGTAPAERHECRASMWILKRRR